MAFNNKKSSKKMALDSLHMEATNQLYTEFYDTSSIKQGMTTSIMRGEMLQYLKYICFS